MRNGRVVPAQDFTTDYAAAAKHLRIPMGNPGGSASPYFCLSDFAKHWPGTTPAKKASPTPKARFVMMFTNGVDPYNGSVSPMNQDQPLRRSSYHRCPARRHRRILHLLW